MTRIYYKEEKIYGHPVEETAIINQQNFDYLMECKKPRARLELTPNDDDRYTDWFRFVEFSNDGKPYNTTEGSFYLPKAIIFYNEDDYTFPSSFFFIARIGNHLEVRSARGGKDTQWFQMPYRHGPVLDTAVMQKMENSLEAVLEFLTDYEEEAEKEEEFEESEHTTEDLKPSHIEGMYLPLPVVEEFLSILDVSTWYASRLVEMAADPSGYFDKNQQELQKYHILSPSSIIYIEYLTAVMQEEYLMATVDWKEAYTDVLYALNCLSEVELRNTDARRYNHSTAGEILHALNKQVETRTDKTIYCIDTDSDSYSFGLIEKNKFSELVNIAEELGITIYSPEE